MSWPEFQAWQGCAMRRRRARRVAEVNARNREAYEQRQHERRGRG